MEKEFYKTTETGFKATLKKPVTVDVVRYTGDNRDRVIDSITWGECGLHIDNYVNDEDGTLRITTYYFDVDGGGDVDYEEEVFTVEKGQYVVLRPNSYTLAILSEQEFLEQYVPEENQ